MVTPLKDRLQLCVILYEYVDNIMMVSYDNNIEAQPTASHCSQKCVHSHTYTHTYTHVHAHAHTNTHTYIHTHMHYGTNSIKTIIVLVYGLLVNNG